MIIGVDHGYHAVKGRHISFLTGIVAYEHEPYTKQGVLEYEGKYYVCGSGRQPLLKNKMANENCYLLTLAAIAKEVRWRTGKTKAAVTIAAGLPLTGFGRDKRPFRKYLLRKQPVSYRYEGEDYEITIEEVKLFPQGYAAIATQTELLNNEPSVLLADIGGWTVDLMRLDNLIPNAATCRSLELGMIRCVDEILEQVRRNTGLSITTAQIERVLCGQTCTMEERVAQIIHKQGRIYTEQLLSNMMESGFDGKAMPVIFMGGGASIVKRNVTEQDALCRAIYLTDVHVNAIGYERIAAQLSAR